ncbi:hypothetical protein BLOT_013233 [Blomia tropicalis]|nr:hypothetical protein BLOT_013233 [Blomia tropicalis]
MVVEEGKIKRSRRRRTISLVRLAAPLARASTTCRIGLGSQPKDIRKKGLLRRYQRRQSENDNERGIIEPLNND